MFSSPGGRLLQSSFIAVALTLGGCAPDAAVTQRTTPRSVADAPREDKASPALRVFLMDRMRREQKALQLQGVAWPVGFTADASILKLDHTARASRDKVSCTVLLTILDSTHSPVAIVHGTASAEDAPGSPALVRSAVGGAAHSAASQLPGLFQKIQKQ